MKTKRIEPYTFDEVNKKKPKSKVTYSVRIQGYHSALENEFDNITDARICRIKLIKQARKSKDEWFKGKIRPYFQPTHKIKNEWIRLSQLYISEKKIHYYWKPNYLMSKPLIYFEPIKTFLHDKRKRVA
tara:strand:- start:44 stop:430 length:387 start_codon:yes stop_codon:yes gene_type:complete